MAFGTLGSTLNDELNRLANGGTYRDKDDMVDEALAAKQWANRENIVPYSTDTVGILNEIAALGPNRQNWYDFNGVCNYLAGTTGLPAAAALRQITTTGDILTSLAAFYTDAATPRYNYPGYITLDGTTTNYISTPSASALQITGDIDLRVKVALDDWTPTAPAALLSKYNSSGTLRSYLISLTTTGTLQFYWSADGTNALSATSSASVPFADGTNGWVRATLDVDNGSSGRDVKFFTSNDGTNWTQLGTTQTTAGVTSIFANTQEVAIGVQSTNQWPFAGKVYQAQIFASINGTDKRLDVDLTTNVTSATYDQFTATTGQLCTINGQNTLTNAGTAGSLLPVTVGSSLAADSNDAKFLAHDGTNYVYLPGVGFNNLVIPDSAELDITGDLDLRAYVALDDWTPSAGPTFIAKDASSGTQSSFSFQMSSAGRLFFSWSSNGTSYTATQSTVSVPAADGAPIWVRAAFDVDNGASGNDVKFYTSTDGSTWTQLGTTVTTAGVTSIFAGTGQVTLGTTANTGAALVGKYYRAQIFNGIDGTKVLDVDTSVITSGADTYVVPTTYTGQTGAYFTGSGLSLNGVSGNYVSTPDSSALDITGDIDIQCKAAMTDWTPAASQALIAKRTTGATQQSYQLTLETTGRISFYSSVDGVNPTVYVTSTVSPTVSDGQTLWVRATLDVDNGAGGKTVSFYTSTDGTTWTQLGTSVTTAGTTSIFNSTAQLEIGSTFSGISGNANGTIYRAIIKSGIDGFTVFDANFETVSANALRMTESSINKAVVTLATTRYATINRSTSGRKTVAVTQPTWLFGTDDYMEVNNRYMDHTTSSENYVYLSGASGNYMSVADNPPLDITGDIDIQVRAGLTSWASGSEQRLVSKFTSGQGSYSFALLGNGTLLFTWYSDGTTGFSATSTASVGFTAGQTGWVRITLDVNNGAGGNTATFYTSTDGVTWTVLGSPVVQAFIAVIYAGTANLSIGANSSGTAVLATGRFYRTIIKNGIDGTTVLDANAAVITLPSQTTFTDSSSNAYTVTINKSGVGTFVSTGNYMYLPGVNLNYASTPDSAALDILGDIDLRIKVALDDWTPASEAIILGKSGPDSYVLNIQPTGILRFQWINAANTFFFSDSTVATGIADGATRWIRVTLDVDNGASGNTVTFFTSTDGITWTQLGSPVVKAGTTDIRNQTGALYVGGYTASGTLTSRGKFFRAQVLNGINGTVAFDANFEGSITSLNQASFTESSSNAATVTINRSGSAYRSAGVIDAGYLYPGATNTFANSTIDYLNFGATDSFTALTVVRQWNTPVSFGRYLSKAITGNTAGWQVMPEATAYTVWAVVRDTGAEVNAGRVSYSQGSLTPISMVANRATQTLTAYAGNNSGSAASISAKGSFSNPGSLWIGTSQAGSAQDFEFIGAAVFRQALTTAQIRQVVNYFANREAYL